MNISEAYSILDVSEDISDDDLKKKYKELAKKFHPDLHKEDPNKFRNINEAYQFVVDYRSNPHKHQQQSYGININDFFTGFNNIHQSRQQRSIPPPSVNINISFKECILGCEKEIQYTRQIKCNTCNGNGAQKSKNDCKHCDGFGMLSSSSQGIYFSQTCGKCYGRGVKTSKCNHCSGEGSIPDEIKGNINIPPGTQTASTLVLRGKGHYMGQSAFGESYADAYMHIHVEKDDDLNLIGKEVISYINISLLDALTGCDKEVKTIHGMKQISIPPSSKNKDEINIQGCGVQNGIQRVIIDISYPKDTQSIIDLLKQGLN